ncbi:hypothetical protein [Polaribacter sp. Z022]|uniref:hypothetical protein n=1 Tax=Polaribacter sp. Z022 TaxID=2927125 RepID=UPI0020213806|nr:hypothetical protein [Polaribacter sp. Z022]MCL7755018.1 hypothetical protein [Polaribacter sp. Z022]
MNGYLNGESFQQTVRRILLNAEEDSLSTYFVNTKEYSQTNLKDKIANKKIATTGIGNSDHKFIFTNAIKNAKGNNLSIVITDGIYSMKGGNIALVEIDIEDAFKKALMYNELETVVLKMTSNFKGTYYSETCKPGHKAIKINQTRPYYLFLFGNKDVINKTFENIVIKDDLKGLEEESRFIITKDLNVNYTVLTQGEEKKGNFKQSGRKSVVKEIGDAEKSSKKGVLLKDRYLQFGIGVDYSKSSIPESYLLNTSNYSIEDNTGYKIEEIKKVSDLDKGSKSYKWVNAQNEKGKFTYTHIVVVKAKTKLYGDLSLSLDINSPEWITKTGTVYDCSIKNDTSTTFAFDRLMAGVSKAYQKVSDKKEFFKINIKVKAN